MQMWTGVSPVPGQLWAGVSPVPVKMWQQCAESRCRCGAARRGLQAAEQKWRGRADSHSTPSTSASLHENRAHVATLYVATCAKSRACCNPVRCTPRCTQQVVGPSRVGQCMAASCRAVRCLAAHGWRCVCGSSCVCVCVVVCVRVRGCVPACARACVCTCAPGGTREHRPCAEASRLFGLTHLYRPQSRETARSSTTALQ